MKNNRNVRIVLQQEHCHAPLHIYLDFSGQREYLMTHRPNLLLGRVLQNGMTVESLRRSLSDRSIYRKVSRKNAAKAERLTKHLLDVIDAYMIDRADSEEPFDLAFAA